MQAYCDRSSVDMNAIAFLFDGRRLKPEQTPQEVCSSCLCSCKREPRSTSHGLMVDRSGQTVYQPALVEACAGDEENVDARSFVSADGLFCLVTAEEPVARSFGAAASHFAAIAHPVLRLLRGAHSEWVQLEMEDGDEIDAMLHQTGGQAL